MQESSVNLQQIESYAAEVAYKICQETFANTHSLNKKDINQFSSIEQLNQILLKNLHSSWQEQYDTLQSNPYFDYDHPEVRECIENLIKLLPKHIKITKAHFLSLLNESIKELLFLVLDPLYYFKQQLNTLPKSIVIREEFEDLISFYTIHQEALTKACNKLKKTRIIAKRGKILREIEKALEQSTPLSPREIFSEFDHILPLPTSLLEGNHSRSTVKRVANFTEEQPKPAQETPVTKPQQREQTKQEPTPKPPEKKEINHSKPRCEKPKKTMYSPVHKTEEKTNQTEDNTPADLDDFLEIEDLIKDPQVEEIENPPETAEVQKPPEEEKVEEPTKSISVDDKVQSDNFAEEVIKNLEAEEEEPKDIPTHHEKLQQENAKKTSVHDKLTQQASRKLSMSINQRLNFINKLFKGNKQDFETVVALVESQATYQEIMNELKRSYMPKYEWELTNETTKEFFSLIDSVIE